MHRAGDLALDALVVQASRKDPVEVTWEDQKGINAFADLIRKHTVLKATLDDKKVCSHECIVRVKAESRRLTGLPLPRNVVSTWMRRKQSSCLSMRKTRPGF